MSLCVTYKESMEFRGLMFQNTTKIGWILCVILRKFSVSMWWYGGIHNSLKVTSQMY